MDSELLFIIKKKFYNRRVVRTIYEYLKDTRTTYLKKYRSVINNGCCPATTRLYYLQSGVCSGKKRTHGRMALASRCKSAVSLDDTWSRVSRGEERYWRLSRLANVGELEKIKYIIPLTMNIVLVRPRQCRNPLMYKFTTKRLFDCCIENKTPGIEHLIRGRYSRETLLKALMSI